MAELEWAGTSRAGTAPLSWLRQLSSRFTDWEDWLTLLLMLGAVLTVSGAIESGGWSNDMPAITLMSALSAVASLFLARSRLPMVLAWPLGVVFGALVTVWLTLESVGPGNLEQRVDAVYFRFKDWIDLAFGNGVSKDSLPFDTLVLALTWLGVLVVGWSVYRWHNAWLGLIPGGFALFIDFAFVGDSLTGAILLYLFFGALLVMRTNLMAHLARWREQGATYPPLISLTFLNFGTWVILALLASAWVAPVGPFSTPAPVEQAIIGLEKIGANFLRLAGPLHVKKIVPVHSYADVLPFQGSVKLGDREVLTVQVNDANLRGPFTLRGAVYDIYSSGGWEAGERVPVKLPAYTEARLKEQIKAGEVAGQIVPLTVTVERRSVVGTVLFSPGEPVSTSGEVDVLVPVGALEQLTLYPPPEQGPRVPDDEAFADFLKLDLDEGIIPLEVLRDTGGRVSGVRVFDGGGQPLADTLVIKPAERLGEGKVYSVTGFVPEPGAHALLGSGFAYPGWLRTRYTQLPETLPAAVAGLTYDVVSGRTELPGDEIYSESFGQVQPFINPYEAAKAIELYLRAYPIDYGVAKTVPGEDAVYDFLFNSRRGYFDYHASAMVVMMRVLGVPSRLAVGFVIDETDFDEDRQSYSVRDQNTYAWPEVYFPGYGWIAFNPTPDRSSQLSPTALVKTDPLPSPPPADATPQSDEADPIFGFPVEGLGGGGDGAPVSGGRNYNPLITAGVAGFLAMLAGAVWLGWQRSVAGLPYSQQLWEKTVRLASWGGHPPQPGQTPANYAQHLEGAYSEAEGLGDIADAYGRSRYGRPEAEGNEREELKELWPQVRGALLGGIAARVLRRRSRSATDR